MVYGCYFSPLTRNLKLFMDLFFEKERCFVVKILKKIKKLQGKWINPINLPKIVIMLNNLKW